MKLISLTCPSCGAKLQVDSERKKAYCTYCGSHLLIDDEVKKVQYENAEQTGYEFEKGRIRAQVELNPKTHTPQLTNSYSEEQSLESQVNHPKRLTWLWFIGWLLFFPLPLTILILKTRRLSPSLKFILTMILWTVLIVFAKSHQAKVKIDDNSSPISIPPSSVISIESETDSTIQDDLLVLPVDNSIEKETEPPTDASANPMEGLSVFPEKELDSNKKYTIDFTPSFSDPSLINVLLNGEELEFDTPPAIINNLTMVPIRVLFEALDYTVEWDQQTQQVSASNGSHTIVLTLNSTTAFVNEEETQLEASPCIIDGHTMIPLRDIAEIADMDVAWNAYAKTVFINDPATYRTIKNTSGYLCYRGQISPDNKRCGFGISYDNNGNVIYSGQWLNNTEYGIGSFTWESGITYQGDCKDGQASGNGIMVFPEIGAYAGSFLLGDRSGYGIFIWNDGEQYQGDWVNDMMDGSGTYTFADGEVITGTWSKNEFIG